jgi:hypothetical protein
MDLDYIRAEALELCRNAEPLGDGYSKVLTQDLEALQLALGIPVTGE